MKKYETLSHPAELRLRIYGKTIEKLFANAAGAMADILASNVKRQASKAKKEKIKIQSVDNNALLVDFLSEVLAKSQINKCVYQVSDIRRQASDRQIKLQAEIISCPVERFDEDIKAVTYYGLDIKKNPKGVWQTDLLFDI